MISGCCIADKEFFLQFLVFYTAKPKKEYTLWSKSLRTDFFFKSKTHEEDTYLFFIQNKLKWHIYGLLRSHTVSEKLLKIPLFGPSLILSYGFLDLSDIHKVESFYLHFQLGEQRLMKINLESTRGDKGLKHFFGSKIGKRSFVGWRIIVQQEKISRAESSWMTLLNALQQAIHYSFIKFCIYCFSL